MVNYEHRFHGRASIQRLYKSGASVRSGALVLRYARNPRRSSYRTAVVVSRKVSKSAVVRNRIRRRIYEVVRILSSNFIEPCDLLVLVYDEKIAAVPHQTLLAEVRELMRKAKLASSVRTPKHDIVEP